jgi:hypothetical protein
MAFDLRPRSWRRRSVHLAREDALAIAAVDAAVLRRKGLCFSQDDQSVANAPGASVRADMNSNLQALVTLSSGTAAPGTTWAYQLWADTTNGLLKQRNAANSGWLVRGSLIETFVLARSSNTIIALGDFARTFNCTSTFTQTITAAATLGDGFVFGIRNNGTGVITIDPNGAETIDGAASIDLAPGYTCQVMCNGAAFFTVGLPRRRAEVTPGGRLTLTTAVPVTTADVTGATTVYYTPYQHDTVELYDGAVWNKHQFAELSQATSDSTKSPAAVGASSNYDVFVWNDAGTLRATRGPVWSSATTRGTGAGTTELELFEGRLVNKVAITNGPGVRKGVYVGSIRSDASSQINDSYALRHCWNTYNRVLRQGRNNFTADRNTASTTYVELNSEIRVSYLLGLDEGAISIHAEGSNVISSSLHAIFTAVGFDGTTFHPGSETRNCVSATNGWGGFCISALAIAIGIGSHYATLLGHVSSGGSTGTWGGAASGADAARCYLHLTIMG